ncbi:MAG: hypothetical protein P1U40_08320 [Coxiellaceae bacterium]|nr:hypothetical protein [Coxiellaceae bacterium]
MSIPITPPNTLNKKSHRQHCLSITNVMASLCVASPIIFLNMLASASSKSNNAAHIGSLQDLKGFFSKTKTFDHFAMAITLATSAGVLGFLNRLYLWPSVTSSAKLFTVPYDFYTRHHKTKPKTQREIKKINTAMKRWPIDVGFCLWSLATSLIFAEIGSKSFAFMGVAGEFSGGILSFSIHYASRFLSIQYFIDEQLNKNLKLKKLYIHKLEQLDSNTGPQIAIVDSTSTEQALHSLLHVVDTQWEHLPKNNKQHHLLHTAPKVLGCSLVAFLLVPIFAGFMPECVQGAELLFNVNIGKDYDYKNAASFGFGGFSTALTWFFYSVNAYQLPKLLINTTLDCIQHATQGSKLKAAKYSFLTVAACVSSYLTSPSFRLVGQHTYSQGYISYLGNYGRVVPGALSTAFIFMLWSHLQAMILDSSNNTKPKDIDPHRMDIRHALQLLQREDTLLFENLDTQPLQSVVVETDTDTLVHTEAKTHAYDQTPQHSPTSEDQPPPPHFFDALPFDNQPAVTQAQRPSISGRKSRGRQIAPTPEPPPSPSPFA